MNCEVKLLVPDNDFISFWASEIAQHLKSLFLSFNTDDSSPFKSKTQLYEIEWRDFIKNNIVQPSDEFQEISFECLNRLISKTKDLYLDIEAKLENPNCSWMGWVSLPYVKLLKNIIIMFNNMLRKKYMDKDETTEFWIKLFRVYLNTTLQFLSMDSECWKKNIIKCIRKLDCLCEKKTTLGEYIALLQTIYVLTTQIYGHIKSKQINSIAPFVYFEIFTTEENRGIANLYAIKNRDSSSFESPYIICEKKQMAYPLPCNSCKKKKEEKKDDSSDTTIHYKPYKKCGFDSASMHDKVNKPDNLEHHCNCQKK